MPHTRKFIGNFVFSSMSLYIFWNCYLDSHVICITHIPDTHSLHCFLKIFFKLVYVSVSVSTRIWNSPFNGQIRLSRGAYTNEGLVEVYCNGRWGTVCDDSFGINEADVVCRQLGYSTAARFDHLSLWACCFMDKYKISEFYCMQLYLSMHGLQFKCTCAHVFCIKCKECLCAHVVISKACLNWSCACFDTWQICLYTHVVIVFVTTHTYTYFCTNSLLVWTSIDVSAH